jgi:hypothetical protein
MKGPWCEISPRGELVPFELTKKSIYRVRTHHVPDPKICPAPRPTTAAANEDIKSKVQLEIYHHRNLPSADLTGGGSRMSIRAEAQKMGPRKQELGYWSILKLSDDWMTGVPENEAD